MPPGITPAELLAKPFHVYDEEFLSIIGENPTLTLLAEQATNPLYHEAVVWLVVVCPDSGIVTCMVT